MSAKSGHDEHEIKNGIDGKRRTDYCSHKTF